MSAHPLSMAHAALCIRHLQPDTVGVWYDQVRLQDFHERLETTLYVAGMESTLPAFIQTARPIDHDMAMRELRGKALAASSILGEGPFALQYVPAMALGVPVMGELAVVQWAARRMAKDVRILPLLGQTPEKKDSRSATTTQPTSTADRFGQFLDARLRFLVDKKMAYAGLGPTAINPMTRGLYVDHTLIDRYARAVEAGSLRGKGIQLPAATTSPDPPAATSDVATTAPSTSRTTLPRKGKSSQSPTMARRWEHYLRFYCDTRLLVLTPEEARIQHDLFWQWQRYTYQREQARLCRKVLSVVQDDQASKGDRVLLLVPQDHLFTMERVLAEMCPVPSAHSRVAGSDHSSRRRGAERRGLDVEAQSR